MQKSIKLRSPIKQLLETVNFAFMKIYDFLVKIAIFEAFFHFLAQPVKMNLNKKSFPKHWSVQTMIFGP